MATNWKWEDLDETYNGTSVIWSRSYTAIAGTLTSAGTVAKETARSLTGGVTSAGAIAKGASKPLAGALTSVGVLAKKTGKTLAGLLPFVITWDTLSETWDGTTRYWVDVSWASLTKKTIRPLAGGLTSAGAVAKKALKPLAGALTPAGVLVNKVLKVLAGALTGSGAVVTVYTAAVLLTLKERILTLTLRKRP